MYQHMPSNMSCLLQSSKGSITIQPLWIQKKFRQPKAFNFSHVWLVFNMLKGINIIPSASFASFASFSFFFLSLSGSFPKSSKFIPWIGPGSSPTTPLANTLRALCKLSSDWWRWTDIRSSTAWLLGIWYADSWPSRFIRFFSFWATTPRSISQRAASMVKWSYHLHKIKQGLLQTS